MIPPKHILYPVNIESKNMVILNRVFIMAKNVGGTISLLFVDNPQAGYRSAAVSEEDFEKIVKEKTKPELLEGVDIKFHVRKGELGDEVKQFCTDHPIDLIITGHKHHNKLYSALFDTPEESIIDLVNIPVLVIPKNIAIEESDITSD